ncbi:E3 ubiquitin-protein ligase PPP1R11 [Toxorhynchites rutilus septentrionalis]|uniref:E3 ubiquitin-protein ligase PPP1R11 n=1 Tax=Toxorhynchites rutilus septentrionalis TaxID=329112 RepID=UPI00247A2858|nr:E3 ubiquitin-protein ligase PPP1R11 [Toxorhynchites rutilus septentrionalis]
MATEHSEAAMHAGVASSSTSRTITETLTSNEIPGTSNQEPPVLRLRLQKPHSSKKVQWSNGTVDNEHMNRKKSKCCCIYVKPREFGESSSESEDECEHCFGHVELKKKIKPKATDSVDSGGGQDTTVSVVEAETNFENDSSPNGNGNDLIDPEGRQPSPT